MPKIASLYGRDMQVINGIIVWRDKKHFIRPALEKRSAENENVFWGSASWNRDIQVAIRREEENPASAAETRVKTDTDILLGTEQNRAALLPARLLSIEAKNASASRVSELFSARSGWNVTMETAQESRRLSAQLHRVTPGQALEALTWLLNARQKVTIGQSDAQSKQDAQLAQDAADNRSPRFKLSDALAAELSKHLTPEQKADLNKGWSIELDVNSFSSALQKQAMEYVNYAENDTRKHDKDLPELDKKRRVWLEYRIGLGISVQGYDKEGGRIGF